MLECEGVTTWLVTMGTARMVWHACHLQSMRHYQIHSSNDAIPCSWDISASLFTLRRPCSPLILNGEKGLLKVNRLYRRANHLENKGRFDCMWCMTQTVYQGWSPHFFSQLLHTIFPFTELFTNYFDANFLSDTSTNITNLTFPCFSDLIRILFMYVMVLLCTWWGCRFWHHMMPLRFPLLSAIPLCAWLWWMM